MGGLSPFILHPKNFTNTSLMKLHLPKLLRNSVLACIAAVASITTTTVGTATFTGGVVAFALASQQAQAANDLNIQTAGNFWGGDFSFDICIADAGMLANGTSDLVAYYSGGSWADTYGSNGYVLNKNSDGEITLTVGRGALSSSNAFEANMTFASGDDNSKAFTTVLQAGKVYTVKVTGGDQNQVVSLWDGDTELETAAGYKGNMNGGNQNTTLNSAINAIYKADSLYWKGSGEGVTLTDAANWQTATGGAVDDLTNKTLVLYSPVEGAATTLSASGEVQLFTLGTQSYTVNVTDDLTINNGGLSGSSTFNVAENKVLKLVGTTAAVKFHGAGKVQIGSGSKLSVYAGNGGNPSVSTAVEVLAGGTLRLENSDSLGWGGKPVASVLLQGTSSQLATMQMTAKETLKTNVTLAGNARVTGGTFEFFGGKLIATGTNNIISSTIFSREEQLGSDHIHVIQVTGTDDALEISGNFTRRGGSAGQNRIVKQGEGTLTLSYRGNADNTFYDGFTVEQGAVVLSGKATVTGSALIVNEDASLTVSGDLTIDRAIENAGELLCAEDGRIIINATEKEGYVDATGAAADNGFVGCEDFQAITGVIPQDFCVYLGNNAYEVREDGMVTNLVDYSTYHMNSGEATLNAADVKEGCAIGDIEHAGGTLNVMGSVAVQNANITGKGTINATGELVVTDNLNVSGMEATLSGKITIAENSGSGRFGINMTGNAEYDAATDSLATPNLIVTGEGTEVTTKNLYMSDDSGKKTLLKITDNATLAVTGTNWTGANSDSFLLGHWTGGSRGEVLIENGGALNVLNAGIGMVHADSGVIRVNDGGTLNIAALARKGASKDKVRVYLDGGTINIGEFGIGRHSATGTGTAGDFTFNINGGTLGILSSTDRWDTYMALATSGDLTINTEKYDAEVGAYTGEGGTIGLNQTVTTGDNKLIKTGAGTLVLGATAMEGAKLVVNEGYVSLAAATGALKLGSLATEGGSILLGSGQTIELGAAAGKVTFTLQGVDFAENATTATVTVATGSNLPGSASIEYFTDENVTASYANGVVTLTKNDTALTAGSLTWKTDGDTNTWASSTAQNWTADGAATRFVNGSSVTFGADASSKGETIAIEGNITTDGVTVNGTGWVFTGSGSIGAWANPNDIYKSQVTGGGKLTVSDGASVTFAGSGKNYMFNEVALGGAGATITIARGARVINQTIKAYTYGNVVLNDGTLSILPRNNQKTLTISNLTVSGTSILETVRSNQSYATNFVVDSLTGSGDFYLKSGSQETAATVFTLNGSAADFSGNLHLEGNAEDSSARRVTLNVNSDKALSQAVIHFDDANNKNNLGFGVAASTVTVAGLKGGVDGANSSLIIFSGSGAVATNEEASDTTTRTLNIATKAGDDWSTSALVKSYLNLNKTGEGSQSFTGNMSSFNGSITVGGGTLNMSTVGNSTAISLTSAGATLGVTGEGAGVELASGKSLTAVNGAVLNSALSLNGGALTLGTTAASWALEGGLDLGGNALSLSADNKTALTLNLGSTVLGASDSVELFTNATLAAELAANATLSTYFSGVSGNLANAALSFADGKLVATLPAVLQESLTWGVVPGEGESVTSGIWADGETFGNEGSGTFDNGDVAVFAAISGEDTVESVVISGEVTADSVSITAGEGKTYSFSSTNSGVLSTDTLEIGAGTAKFNKDVLNFDSLDSLVVNGTLDLKAYNNDIDLKNVVVSLNEVGSVSGTGTILFQGGGDDYNNNSEIWLDSNSIDGKVWEPTVNMHFTGHVALHGRSNGVSVAEAAQVIIKKNLTVTGGLRVQGRSILKVDGGNVDVTNGISLGHGSAANYVGMIELISGSIKAASITRTNAGDATTADVPNYFKMTDGTLELTTNGTNIQNIVTTITGGTLKADSASWGITGGTIGAATLDEGGNPVLAVKIVTTGENTITLSGSTLASMLDNSAGKLTIAGATRLDTTSFNHTDDQTAYSNKVTGNGRATLDQYYQLSTDVDNLTIGTDATFTVGTTGEDGTFTGVEGTYISSDGTWKGWVQVHGTEYGSVFFVNAGTVQYGADSVLTDSDSTTTAADGYESIAIQGGTLQVNADLTTTAGKNIELKSTGAIDIASGVTLAAGRISGTGTATLSGNGVYDLGTVTNLGEGITIPNALKVTLGGEWTGTVRVSGTIDTAHLKNLGNANSWIQIDGLSGKGRHEVSSGVELTGAGYTITGHTETLNKFLGAVKGSADFTIKSADGNAMNYIFSGDTAAWSGGFVVAQHESTATPTVSVELTGGGNVFASGAKGIEMNRAGTLNVTIGSTAEATTMNGDISKVADATLNLTTVGEVTMAGTLADGIGLTNNGTLELTQDAATLASLAGAGSVSATGTALVVSGAVTDESVIVAASIDLQGAENITGDLTAKTGNVKLADGFNIVAGNITAEAGSVSLGDGTNQVYGAITAEAGDVSIGAGECMVTGAITAQDVTIGAVHSRLGNRLTSIKAETLTLQGGINNVSGINLTGDLTLGTADAAAQLISSGPVTIGGNVTVNKLSGGLVGDALVADVLAVRDQGGNALTLSFDIKDSVLRDFMLDYSTNTFTLATVENASSLTATFLDGKTTIESADQTFEYTIAVNSGVVTISREAMGTKWVGGDMYDHDGDPNTDEVARSEYWSGADSWSGEKPTANTTVVLAGTGGKKVLFGNKDAASGTETLPSGLISETITVDNVVIECTDAARTYEFASADGSDWNKLNINKNLMVSKGYLKVDSAVNIYSKGYTGVEASGTFEIGQNAFVRAEAGIEIAGKVMVDAWTAGGTTTNSGKLYVMNGGDVNIHAGATVTIGGNEGANGGVLAAVAEDAMLDGSSDTYEYDDMAYNSNPDKGTGSDIYNAGTIVSTGQIVAVGDMFNSGSVTQTAGELFVYGAMTNTGADILVADGAEKPAGMAISGGDVKVGTLTNSDTILLSGEGTKLEVTGIKHINGEEDKNAQMVTVTTEYESAALINSGVISITGGAALEVLDTQDSTLLIDLSNDTFTVTPDEYVDGSLVNEEGGVINIGTAAEGETPATTGSLVVNGNLANSGEINLVQGTIDVTDDLDNRGGTIALTKGSIDVTGDLDNTGGTLTIAGGNLGTDAEDNTIYNLNVGGDLTNTDGTVSISGEGTKAHVGGDLTLNPAGTDTTGSTLTVGEATELAVDGDLSADDVSLGFDGKVTVGGTATMENLTIAKGGEFIAENATISDTFANNGSLTVTTTLVVDENGEPELDLNGNIQYTGGNLVIGTLDGDGEVHVQEGGSVSIANSKNFVGELDNKGILVFNGKSDDATFSNTQYIIDSVQQTAGDITAGTVTVTEAAKVATRDAQGNVSGATLTGYKMGDVRADVLVIDGLATKAADGTVTLTEGTRLVTDSLVDKNMNFPTVKLVFSDVEDQTMTSGKASALETTIDAYYWAGFDLTNYGIINEYTAVSPEGLESAIPVTGADGRMYMYVSSLDAVKSDYMQELLKQGKRVYVDITDANATANAGIATADESALRKIEVSVRIDELQDSERIWKVGNTQSTGGLIVLDGAGDLASDTILETIKTVQVDDSDDSIDLTGGTLTQVVLNNLTDTTEGKNAGLELSGDATDTFNITTDGDSYATGTLMVNAGTVNLNGGKDVNGNTQTSKVKHLVVAPNATANIELQGSKVSMNQKGEATFNGNMKDGLLELVKGAAVGDKSTLNLDMTDVKLIRDNVVTTDMVETGTLETMGEMTGSVDKVEVHADNAGTLAGEYYKYFDMDSARLENSAIVADRNTSHYRDNYSSESANGAAGLEIADEILTEYYPQLNRQEQSELANALDAIENAGSTTARDELAASLAGASSAVLGMAVSGDVDRQLRAIRNRTTTMGVDQSVANEDMPYFNAWINAEGSMNELSDNGTEGGYKLNSWGGTVGFDVDVCPTFTAGMAFTAMYGDLDVTGADTATGDLDTYYLSAFARYSESAWTHTFVATVGTGDISMKRTVLGSEQKVETDALSFGLMYEVGRVFALDEDGSACLQPVFNVTWKHTTVDGYTEDGSDLALKVDEQTVDTVTFGLGARLQAVVGESMYNRTSIFEARVLAKADVGDRNGSADVGLASLGCTKHEVESAEMGAFGLEAGAGLTIPVGEEGGSIFMDASVELRSDYTDVNGTVGYRINF